MQELDDIALLREYVERDSQEAFAALVGRHVNKVYSVEADHHALVLRFFDDKSMKEIGAALGASEAAAKMRVNRAVEKLRLFFTRRGIVCPAAALTAAISANSVQAAPAVLANTATTVAIADGATASASTLTLIKGALKIMAWTKTKPVLVLSAVVSGILATTFEVRNTRADQQADDSWRSAGLTWQQVGQTAPQVKILPTKFQPPVYHMLTSDGIKRGVDEIHFGGGRVPFGRRSIR